MQDGIRVSIIVATDVDGTIGNSKKPGGLPWPPHKADMKRFVAARKGRPVVIGRKSYEFIPPQFRPFRGSPTIVISGSKDFSFEKNSLGESPKMAPTTREAVKMAIQLAKESGVNEVIIAGGERVYRETMAFDIADRIYITKIVGRFEGDASFPSIYAANSSHRIWIEDKDGFETISADAENPCSMIFMTFNHRSR